jgi:acetoin utilization protein AcuC
VKTALVFDARMAAYGFGRGHPMLPERFTLAVDLMDAWGLLGGEPNQAERVAPIPAASEDLRRVHSADYIAAVKDEAAVLATDEPYGLGPGDTPRFPRMHEVSALIAGATCGALDGVLDGTWTHAFNPAGGLHHAHRNRAAGFCVYNDCAVAIARATALRPGLRIAYVDIDAHHGDGVQEAFYERPDVLTVSVHESGRYLYPGTGATRDTGTGDGIGTCINVPLPPQSGPAEYDLVFDQVVEPGLSAFSPDVIVAQLGADALSGDPLAHLALTVRGHYSLVARLVACAGAFCDGRLVATGGGGYDAFSATPRAWACAMSALLGREAPEELPPVWLEAAVTAARGAGFAPPSVRGTFDERSATDSAAALREVREITQRTIDEVVAASRLLAQGS